MTEIFRPGIYDGNQKPQPVIKPYKEIEPPILLPEGEVESFDSRPRRDITWPH